MPKLDGFLYEKHWRSPTLTLLDFMGVLGVLNVLNLLNVPNVLNMLNVLNVLDMPKDASLACWALFFIFETRAIGQFDLEQFHDISDNRDSAFFPSLTYQYLSLSISLSIKEWL